ncbi:hypothetical protein LOTGIDRAFT_140883 [Lottia gigantea]|uniref:Integrator complex subunit 3 N-terminal domain-containing protein n=1 Tax=Lottia gigantea TaxID=225164 RepID=V4CEI2_LOTGI|nr:hypothetical protein LOTGIDRAFT_140883 [Lottia gigantea]ESP00345.1 hypothetical protein LOTGIDRAFT_140883 [Lottia gigantea]
MAKPESGIKKHAPSRLSSLSVLETRDELEEKLDKCYKCVTNLLNGLSEREANDALNAYISKGAGQHEEVQLGLLFSILVDSKTAVKCYRDMTLTSRDGLNIVLLKTNTIIYEKWLRLADSVRTQILWLIRELIKNNVPGADSVCFILLRQISGGDISTKNVYLCESTVDMFYENKSWLEKQTGLIPSVVYTFLRVMIDHNLPSLATVRQKETDLCILLLREKFVECMVIGRDLVRLLQNVSRIPEFEKLWFDLMKNPTAISPQFTGLLQLFQIRTSRKYLVSRLTPDMENKLVFLITKVKFGQQKRYQDWFQRQYLSTPESQTLRCDLIRYICAVFHPSNELLCSDIIPRWAVIGWLLTTCTSPVALSIAKLALFYDWYFFEPEKDSIMNIEPAILVMYHSMRPHPAITATLLDFIARTYNNFCPMLMNQVKQGIKLSLQTIVNKRVLPSLSPLFDNSKLDKELRMLLQETFPEFCSVEVKDEVNKLEPIDVDNSNGENHLDNNSSEIPDARFSDDEDDIPIGRLGNDVKFQPIRDMPCYQHVDISENIQQLAGDIKDLTVELQSER